MQERISKIAERWFLSEEALFSTFCTHRVTENSGMGCHIRVGKGVIEVNPDLCADITDKELEERLRVEVIRILLKHPYDRQPDGCSLTARALGSNCVIGDSYQMQIIDIEKPVDFRLPPNGHFEFYARCIQKILQKMSEKEGTGEALQENKEKHVDKSVGMKYAEIAKNWQQDELMAAQINEVIHNVKSWGSLPGHLVEEIYASTKARVDHRKILAGFRASILSERRKLTRMRPNRRSGFETMGSRYDFTTSMIIGVDCSGSISTEDLQNFYTTINHFFQYGIHQIDVVQFDTELGEVQTLVKASEKIKITGNPSRVALFKRRLL